MNRNHIVIQTHHNGRLAYSIYEMTNSIVSPTLLDVICKLIMLNIEDFGRKINDTVCNNFQLWFSIKTNTFNITIYLEQFLTIFYH